MPPVQSSPAVFFNDHGRLRGVIRWLADMRQNVLSRCGNRFLYDVGVRKSRHVHQGYQINRRWFEYEDMTIFIILSTSLQEQVYEVQWLGPGQFQTLFAEIMKRLTVVGWPWNVFSKRDLYPRRKCVQRGDHYSHKLDTGQVLIKIINRPNW